MIIGGKSVKIQYL